MLVNLLVLSSQNKGGLGGWIAGLLHHRQQGEDKREGGRVYTRPYGVDVMMFVGDKM